MPTLIQALEVKEQGAALVSRLQDVVRPAAETRLRRIGELFPEYTDHSIRHSEEVLRVLDWLIPDEVKLALNHWELYILVAAAYLHDIGMVRNFPAEPAGQDWLAYLASASQNESDAHKILANYIRDRHHERSEDFISNNADALGLTISQTPHEARLVGRISLGHRKVDLAGAHFSDQAFHHHTIRRRLLAAYLRLADELDVTSFRTPYGEYESATIVDPVSYLEWQSHLQISGVIPVGNTIVIGGQCDDPDTYLHLQARAAGIQSKLDEVTRLVRSPIRVSEGQYIENPIPFDRIELQLELRGFDSVDISFTLDQSAVTHILGTLLYDDDTACIRELLQNSVDACREAGHIRPPSWSPSIQLTESADRATITVSDNGSGMSEHIIRKYFTRIGMSYYQSSEFDAPFAPISRFGIGFLSCFSLADRITVNTLRQGHDPILIDIRSASQPIVLKRGTRTTPGTDVCLHLKSKLRGTIDLTRRAAHFARHVEYPILSTNYDGDTHVISTTNVTPTDQHIAEALTFPNAIQGLPSSYFELRSAVASDGNVHVGVLLWDPGSHLVIEYASKFIKGYDLAELSMSPRSFFYQDGFFVGHELHHPMRHLPDVYVDNFTGSAVELLTPDRTKAIQHNPSAWSTATELASEALEVIFRKLHPEYDNSSWWDYHSRHYGLSLKSAPRRLLAELRRSAKLCSFSDLGFSPINYRDLDTIPCLDDFYVIGLDGHDDLVWLQGYMPSGVTIVPAPPLTDGDAPEWFWKASRLAPERGLAALVKRIGGELRNIIMLGQEFTAIDLGRRIGPWALRLQPTDIDDFRAKTSFIVDARHPMTELLLSNPRSAPRLINSAMQHFENAPMWDRTLFDAAQRELMEVLVGAGYISDLEVKCVSLEENRESHHCCFGEGARGHYRRI